ncbi:MAG: response regulator transcription factor [Proteobacteria bacterium]|nr:response regulator transcription factor [Pseudomonadota bacterium]
MEAQKLVQGSDPENAHRIMLIDDHPLVTSGLARIMGEKKWTVVAELAETTDLSEKIKLHKPNVVITDLVMPGPDIIESLSGIRKGGNPFKLIFLSAYFSETNLSRSYHAGADGIVSKTDGPDEVMNGIENVLNGSRYISESLLGQFEENAFSKMTPATTLNRLTSREVEILKLLCSGMSLKQVATHLSIAPKTVDRHRTNIMTKLNVHSQVDLVRFAYRENLVKP